MKTLRWMMLGAMLGFVASSAASCGGAPKCGPKDCPFGCCDAAGTCQLGSTDAQCGSQGQACMACGFAQRCNLGVCGAISGTGGSSGQGGGTSSGGGGGMTGGGGGTTGGGGGSVTGGGGGSVTGGGGGSVTGGGGGSVTGGGGGSVTGGGGGSVGGGGGSAGGGGGSAGCTPFNCAGCCRNNACINFPSNFNDTSCGLNGSACIDCASNGFICSATNATCEPSGTGGGGGATGGGGGATGGGGGSTMVAGGDTCATAVTLTAPGSYTGTTVGANNDYVFSDTGLCQGGSSTSTTGPDVVYRISVPANSTLRLDLLPDSNFDATLNLLASSANCSNAPTCLAGSDSDPETITWLNSTGTTANVLVLIDAYSSSGSGTYTLTYSLSP